VIGRISREKAREASKDADDVELTCLREGAGTRVSLDECLHDDRIAGQASEATSEELDHFPASAIDEHDQDDRATAADMVLSYRVKELGTSYPFSYQNRLVTYRGSKTLGYELCLGASLVDTVSGKSGRYLQVAFERAAAVAVAIWLGPRFGYMRTGDPPGSDDPADVQDALVRLSERTPEDWHLYPEYRRRAKSKGGSLRATVAVGRAGKPKDGGTDFLVFSSLDSRIGSVVIAGNCGCGKNWLRQNKHLDRPSESLQRLLESPSDPSLLDCFCLPFHLFGEEDWQQALRGGELTLDRIRLAKLLEEDDNRVYREVFCEALTRNFQDLRI